MGWSSLAEKLKEVIPRQQLKCLFAAIGNKIIARETVSVTKDGWLNVMAAISERENSLKSKKEGEANESIRKCRGTAGSIYGHSFS